MALAELLQQQQGLINEAANIALPEEYFLMDHPDYLEDGFYPEDYFVWPVGHSDYPDLSKNEYESGEDSNPAEDQEDLDDDPDVRELDVVDPINHPVHWIPDRPLNPEYQSFDPRHHYEYNPDDGPDTTKLHLSQKGAKRDNMYYKPSHASERHPLPVEYEYYHQKTDPLHPIHPSWYHSEDYWRPEEPVKKYIDYHGAVYL